MLNDGTMRSDVVDLQCRHRVLAPVPSRFSSDDDGKRSTKALSFEFESMK